MKLQALKFVAFALFIFLFFGCKGPEGPVGPAGSVGSAGPAGKDGPQGEKGKDASMDVQSTSWAKLNFKDGEVTGLTNYTSGSKIFATDFFLHLKDKSQPLLTKEILEDGMYLFYVKYNSTEVYAADYILQEKIFGGGSFNIDHYWKIAGKTTSTAQDYDYLTIYLTSVGDGVWDPYIYYFTPWGTKDGVSVSLAPELVGKEESFYTDYLYTNAPEVRLVTIKGDIGARYGHVDFSDYYAVKEIFNLED